MRRPVFLVALPTLAVLAIGLVTISLADSDKTKKIEGTLVSTFTNVGCTSPIGLCTSGVIHANHGLDGTTYFTADSAAPGPSTATNPSATLSYSGVLTITTKQ